MRFLATILLAWIVTTLLLTLTVMAAGWQRERDENHYRAINRRSMRAVRGQTTPRHMDRVLLRCDRRRAWRAHQRSTKAVLGVFMVDALLAESGPPVLCLLLVCSSIVGLWWWYAGRRHDRAVADVAHWC